MIYYKENKIQTSIKFFEIAVTTIQQYGDDDQLNLGYKLHNLGEAYRLNKMFEKALEKLN